jgi:hypothetical protein
MNFLNHKELFVIMAYPRDEWCNYLKNQAIILNILFRNRLLFFHHET